MQKKSYSAPTITEHGNAIEQTKGMAGAAWEMWGGKYELIEPEPDSKNGQKKSPPETAQITTRKPFTHR